MKTRQLKNAGVTGYFLALFTLAAVTQTFPVKALSGSEKQARYQQEKSEINGDLAAISLQRENMKYLESQRAKYRKEDNREALASTREELCKANADLKREKAYLRADKNDLLYTYKLAIRTHRQELKKDQKDLSAYRDKLNQSLQTGNESEASRYAALVAQYHKEIKNDQLALQHEKQNRNNDILAINKKVMKSEGESQAVLYSENAAATVKNLNFNKLTK